MTETFKAWHRVVRHPTHWMAWQAGRESLKAEIVALVEQQTLLDRDATLAKLAEAVEEL